MKRFKGFKKFLSMEGASTKSNCPSPDGELLFNNSFDCGKLGWGFDPAYTAIITDNGDGSLHLKATSNFGSLVPNADRFPVGDYHIECSVKNVTGNGKVSIRRYNGTWVSNALYSTDGIYGFDFSGGIAEIHVGADGDDTFEADYDYISLTRIITPPVEYLTTNSDEVLTTNNNIPLEE